MESKELAEKLVEEVRADIVAFRSVKSLTSLRETIAVVVHRVEAEGLLNSLKGAEKKALALEVLDIALDSWAPQKYLRFVPRFVRRKILSWLVDRAVATMNKYLKA